MDKKPKAVEQAELLMRYRGPILINDYSLSARVRSANAAMKPEVAQDILEMWAFIQASKVVNTKVC